MENKCLFFFFLACACNFLCVCICKMIILNAHSKRLITECWNLFHSFCKMLAHLVMLTHEMYLNLIWKYMSTWLFICTSACYSHSLQKLFDSVVSFIFLGGLKCWHGDMFELQERVRLHYLYWSTYVASSRVRVPKFNCPVKRSMVKSSSEWQKYNLK